MKKTMILLLVLMLTLTIFLGACSSKPTQTDDPGKTEDTEKNKDAAEGDETPAGPKPITFTLFMGDVNVGTPVDPQTTEIGKKIQELTGVTLDVEYIVGQDEAQKAGVMIASGDYPDLIIPHDQFATYRDAGALVPLNDMLEEYGKNLTAAYGKYLDMLYGDDGKIYSYTPFVLGKDTIFPFASFYIANGALKEADYPTLKTFDEYIDLIRNYVKAHPTTNGQPTIGFSGPGEGWRFDFTMEGGDVLAGLYNTGGYVFDESKNYEAIDRTDKEYRKDYLKKLNALWNEGLLDKELISQTYDQYVAKISSGRVAGFFDERWEVDSAIDAIKKAGMTDAYPVGTKILNPGVEHDSYAGLTTMGTTPGICITTACKDPERAMQYIDRLAEEDIIKLIYWGIEGKHYTMKDGRMMLTPEQIEARKDTKFSETTGVGFSLFWSFPKFAETYREYSDKSGPMIPDYTQEVIDASLDATEKEVLEKYGWKTFLDPLDPPFVSPYGYGWDIDIPEDRQDLADINTKIEELNVNGYYQKMIMCKASEFEGIWNEFVEKYNAIDKAPLADYFTETVRKRVEILK